WNLFRQVDLGDLPTGEFQGQLMNRGPSQVWKQRSITSPAHRSTPIVSKAHVQADLRSHSFHRPVDQLQESLRMIGMASETRFVQLDKVDAMPDEFLHLAVDNG